MFTNVLFVLSDTRLYGLLLALMLSGCFRSTYQQPYGTFGPDPYMQQAPYGAPQPAPYQAQPYGTPGQPTLVNPAAPTPLSSVPNGGYYAPGSNSGNAPSFGTPSATAPPASGGQQVPTYQDPSIDNSAGSDSPYFQGTNFTPGQNTFSPSPGKIEQASFNEPAPEEPAQGFADFDEQQIAMASNEEPENFEPPIRTSRPSPPEFSSPQPLPPVQSRLTEVAAAEEPNAEAGNNPFGLAPPPLDDPKTSDENALEGTVRRDAATNSWYLEFPGAGANAPFGGKMGLAGNPEVLQQLQEGQQFQLHGYLETSDDPNAAPLFQVQKATSLNANPLNANPF